MPKGREIERVARQKGTKTVRQIIDRRKKIFKIEKKKKVNKKQRNPINLKNGEEKGDKE